MFGTNYWNVKVSFCFLVTAPKVVIIFANIWFNDRNVLGDVSRYKNNRLASMHRGREEEIITDKGSILCKELHSTRP